MSDRCDESVELQRTHHLSNVIEWQYGPFDFLAHLMTLPEDEYEIAGSGTGDRVIDGLSSIEHGLDQRPTDTARARRNILGNGLG